MPTKRRHVVCATVPCKHKNEINIYMDLFDKVRLLVSQAETESALGILTVSYTHLDVYKRQPKTFNCRLLFSHL